MPTFQLFTIFMVIVYFLTSPLTIFAICFPEEIQNTAHFSDKKRKKKK